MLLMASEKPFKLSAGNENVFQAPVFKISEHLQLKPGSLAFGDVHDNQVLSAFPVQSQNVVNGTGYDFALVFDFIVHAV
jgi:hypothetical protein